jgi:hypothetical protein
MNETSEDDLLEMCKHYGIPCHGTFIPSELTELKKGNYILNLNGSSHWCGLICDDTCCYFDSFGFPPDQRIVDMMKDYMYNPYDIQALPSSSCGFYVVAFLKFMNGKKDKERAFKLFLEQFSNKLRDNELILSSMLDAV